MGTSVLGSELWRLNRWELSAQGNLRLNLAGQEKLPLAASAFPVCSPNCDQRSYQEPLSYLSPGLGVRAAWSPTTAVRLSAQTRGELRGYLQRAGAPGIPASRKTRQDVRWRSQVGAELGLDASGTFRLLLVQNLLVGASNVAADPGDPQHQFDYGDHNFVEAATELSDSATLPRVGRRSAEFQSGTS